VSKLEGEGGEDGSKVAPVIEVPRAEETGPQLPVRKTHLCERLSDGRLPCPGETVEPEHSLVLFILRPLFELEEDTSPRPLHASLSVATEVPGVRDVTHAVQKGEVCSILLAGYYAWVDFFG